MQWTGAAERVRIYVNTAKKTMQQIKTETGCDVIVNGGLFSGSYKPVCHLKVAGEVLARDQYTYWGYGWAEGSGALQLITDYSAVDNYICCVCLMRNGQKEPLYYDSGVGGARPRTAIGTMPNGQIWVYIGSNPCTPEALRDTAMMAGVRDAVMLDGGDSTRGILPGGSLIVNKDRICHNYICVWTRKEVAKTLTKQSVIDTAKGEVGYIEKASNKDLDDKTANAGSMNFTKYARDLDKISGWYNTKKQGFDWCAVFYEWLFIRTYGQELTKKLLPHSLLSAGCTQAKAMYVAARRFYKQPQPGDQIFFYNSAGKIGHTGIVVAVSGAAVTTIEGNTSSTSGVVANGGCVRQKTYQRTYNRIVGYGRPDWSALPAEPVQPAPQPTPQPAEQKEGVVTVNVPVLKRGSTGATVRAVQAMLVGYGYDPRGVDGSFGPGCEAAVKKFQTAKGLTADGSVGQATWKALLGV